MALTAKQIAWNGLQFSIPITWELVWVDSHHLTFDSHGSPALEIKWAPIKGRYSHRTQLKKLTKGHNAHPGKTISNWQLPASWKQALAQYSCQGFCWQTDSNSGHGATLYCPVCNQAVIFQIFDINKHLSDPHVLNFLKTLTDHREDGFLAWKVFDIQARLPQSLRLNHYQFKPGNHQLALSDKSIKVRLYRWAPASALLANSSLAAFAAKALPVSAEQLNNTSTQGFPAVEMRPPGVSGWYRPLVRWGIKPALKWVLVWHIEKSSRILGISLESKNPFQPDQMTQFSDNFRSNLS
jgi:hypothetical protein